VTLSICGLGMLDESEVETIPRETSDRVIASMNGEDSAEAKAAKLNARLTQGQKAEAVEVEVVNNLDSTPRLEHDSKPDGRSAEDDRPSGEVNRSAAISSPEISPTPQPPQEVPSQPQPTNTATAAVLSDVEVVALETALTGCQQPKRAVDYIVYRGWLEAGKGLEHTQRSAFVNITTKTPAFVRMVDGWKGNQ